MQFMDEAVSRPFSLAFHNHVTVSSLIYINLRCVSNPCVSSSINGTMNESWNE